MAYFLHLLIMAAITIPTTLGFNFVFGKGKILHFGHVGTAIVAAYSLILSQQVSGSWFQAILIAAFCTALISLFFSWLALKLEQDAFGILSIAVHLSLLAIVLNATALTRGALGIPGIPRMPGMETPEVFAIVVVIVVLVWIFFAWKLNASTFGRSLQALSEHRHHSEALGIRRSRVYAGAFLVAGLGTLTTNVFFAQYLGLLHPSDYGFPALIFMAMCIVAGGPGRVFGVTFATVVLILLKEGLRFLPVTLVPLSLRGPILLLLFGVILSVAVFLRRETIFPKQRSV
ncbi:MAG: branched-chain amino acid ABC transporter permease [Candidatus Peribacteraceae bacterium]